MVRSLLGEISEVFDNLAEECTGKRTLRTHEVGAKAAPDMIPMSRNDRVYQ